jgi:signal transduction histidine kinase
MPFSATLKIKLRAAALAKRARRLEVEWQRKSTDRVKMRWDHARLKSLHQETLRLHWLAMDKVVLECEKLRQMVREMVKRKAMRKALLEISEREQQRIGRDVHDGLGQHLHGLSYLAALLEKNLHEDRSRRALEARQLKEYIMDSLELTRSLAHGLQPVQSRPEGLMAGLNELAERTSKIFGIDCRFDCQDEILVQKHGAAIHLYRIAQEALNNAVKHGKATRISINLEFKGQRIVLRVCDNGVGVHRPSRPGRNGQGMGLQIMRHRSEALNGLLWMEKQPAGGTEILCSVPRRSLLSQRRQAL